MKQLMTHKEAILPASLPVSECLASYRDKIKLQKTPLK